VARTIQSSPAFSRHYAHDLQGHVIAAADTGGVTQREYIWLGDLPLAVVEASGVTPLLYTVHADHLGTPQKMTDGAKALVWDAQFKPFSKTHSLTGTAANDNRFLGQYFQAETGFHQNWHRDYDPGLGRYLQFDPLGLVDGPAGYVYAQDGPLKKTGR